MCAKMTQKEEEFQQDQFYQVYYVETLKKLRQKVDGNELFASNSWLLYYDTAQP